MTLFGQRQDTLSRSWIKDNAKLPFLYKGMVVQVSADGLTPVAKSEVFASTRERATKSDTLSEIYNRLTSVLRNDPVLGDLNREEKERLPGKKHQRGEREDPATTRRVREDPAERAHEAWQGKRG